MQNKVKTSKEHYERFAKLFEQYPWVISIAKNILKEYDLDNQVIINKILEDEENRHLNFIRLSSWDSWTIWMYWIKWPLSEKVSLLKHAAIYWVLWFEPQFRLVIQSKLQVEEICILKHLQKKKQKRKLKNYLKMK